MRTCPATFALALTDTGVYAVDGVDDDEDERVDGRVDVVVGDVAVGGDVVVSTTADDNITSDERS